MPRRQTGFDVVRAIGRTLPNVEESTMYGAPALKIRGKLLACMASHKSAEPNTLVVRVNFDQRDALLADDPGTYYLKPHYEEYPSVLVRLDKIDREALKDLLGSAWRTVTREATVKRSRARPLRAKRPGPTSASSRLRAGANRSRK